MTPPSRPRRLLAVTALAALAAAACTGLATPQRAAAICLSTVTFGGAGYVGATLPDPGVVGPRVGPGTIPGCNDVVTDPPLPIEAPHVVTLHRVTGVAPRFAVATSGTGGTLFVAGGAWGCVTSSTDDTLVACLRARTRRYVAGPSLIAPPSARAGEVIGLAVHVRDPAGQRRAVFGLDALLQGKGDDGSWHSLYHLISAIGTGDPPAPVAVGAPGLAIPAIGLVGGAPRRVRLPDVAPGAYRLAKRASLGTTSRWLVSDLEILAP